MQNIVVLGSTGSVGKQTLDVLRNKKGHYRIFGLAVKGDISSLKKQIIEFNPEIVSVAKKNLKEKLLKILPNKKPNIVFGEKGLIELVTNKKVDVVVVATSGTVALIPTLKAIRSNKKILIANKETLIAGNELIDKELKNSKAEILPLDSEHSAIFQCLKGENKKEVKNLILTCSGGSLKNYTKEQLKKVKKEDVLAHPVWNMGSKITVDSANLMNKGFEILEAHYLFKIPLEKIKVVIHPQCIIHSMVEFVDGTIIAEMSVPDMRLPIQYALFHPKRIPSFVKGLDLAKIKELSFSLPDKEKFPCLDIAYRAGKVGGTTPAVLAFANETIVESFLKEEIKFLEISKIIKKILKKHKPILNPEIKDILNTKKWVQEELKKYKL